MSGKEIRQMNCLVTRWLKAKQDGFYWVQAFATSYLPVLGIPTDREFRNIWKS